MTEVDAAREQVEEIITRLFALVERTHAYAERALIELELGKAEGHVLRILEPGRPVLTRDLAERMHKDPSNLTSVLVKLEERGLVDRRVAPHDRRARLLDLTPDGVRLREELLIRLLEDPPAVAGLSADQRALLLELLNQVG